tara:strand:+ start:374 stop:598 length:225 start_codon:yes stop_codon:yes gene_type:complete
MYNPSFFIGIHIHGYGRFIGKFFESILKFESILEHEYGKFEIIISDNCLNDDSIEVIESIKDMILKLKKNNYNK